MTIGSGFHTNANTGQMVRAEFVAKDRKQGMDLKELESAIRAIRAQPGCEKNYKLEVRIGFHGQIRQLIFTPVPEV